MTTYNLNEFEVKADPFLFHTESVFPETLLDRILIKLRFKERKYLNIFDPVIVWEEKTVYVSPRVFNILTKDEILDLVFEAMKEV